MNKYLDGWTAFETVKFLFDFKYESFDAFEEDVRKRQDEVDWLISHEDVQVVSATEYLEELIEKHDEAKMLYEALLANISLALEHKQYEIDLDFLQSGFLLPEDFIGREEIEETEIKFHNYADNTALEHHKCKKRSIAIWLYKIGQDSFSKQVDPSLNAREVLEKRKTNEKNVNKNNYKRLANLLRVKKIVNQ